MRHSGERRATQRTIRRQIIAGSAALVAFAGVQFWPLGSISHADETFSATAAAYGFDATLTNPSLPLGLTLEAAGPVAQAHLDSLQNSDAFASYPYPGDVVAGLPGIAGVLLGGLPTPAYPFIVSTQYGDPPREQNTPGVALSAQSLREASLAKAVGGDDASGTRSTAQVLRSDSGDVTATATTDANALQVSNIVTISGLHSRAVATRDGSGKLTRMSSLSIGQITVPGLAVTLPKTTPGSVPIPNPIPGLPQLPQPSGLPPIPIPFGGQTLNAPNIGFQDGQFTIDLGLPGGPSQSFALPTGSVADAFAAAGVHFAYQAAQNTKTGIIAPALTVQYVLPSPPNNQYFQGATPVSLALGRTSASVELAAIPDATDPGGLSGGGTTGLLPGATTGGGTSGLPGTPGLQPGGNLGGIGTPGPPPAVADGGSVTTTASPQFVRAGLRFDGSDIYVAVALFGLLGFAATSAVRIVGVRLLWGS